MKRLSIIFVLVFIYFSVFAQINKTIIVTTSPKTVPKNKKWIIEAGKSTRVQVRKGTLNSGTLCNALFLSHPRMVSNINQGNYSSAESYMLIFKELEKVPYTNDYTYDLVPISIVDKDFSFDDFKNYKLDDIGEKRIEFKAGENVFVGNCLLSIEMTEIDISQAELAELKKKEKEILDEKERKLSNFYIPINPEKYVDPDVKPKIYDNKLKNIVFTSSSVMYKSPGKGYSFDNSSNWTLNLNINELSIQNSNGINKIYTVISIEYDKQMKCQKFNLGSSNNTITHKLLISWSNNSKQYNLILSSLDNSEEFQFQEVKSINKQYQNL